MQSTDPADGPRLWRPRTPWLWPTICTLAAATCVVLWIASLYGDALARLTPWTTFQVRNGGFWVWIIPTRDYVPATHDASWCHRFPFYDIFHATWWSPASPVRQFKNMLWLPALGGPLVGFPALFIPQWILALPLSILAFFGWRRWLGVRGPGVCRNCGYDRAGLPPNAPCPECGWEVPKGWIGWTPVVKVALRSPATIGPRPQLEGDRKAADFAMNSDPRPPSTS